MTNRYSRVYRVESLVPRAMPPQALCTHEASLYCPRNRFVITLLRYPRLRRFVAYLCVMLLALPPRSLAVTDPHYRGTSIPGRTSVAMVTVPSDAEVNTYTGNLFVPRTDLYIPGRGLPIDLEVAYNSDQNGINGPFGYGWRFSYGMKCLFSASGNVVVEWGDGRTDLFRRSAGSYTPYNEGVFASLNAVGSNFVLTTKEQIQFLFDGTHGLLQQIQGPSGNVLSLSYNASLQLTTVTDASGRKITFNYNGSGQITQIVDTNTSPTRMLQYTYDSKGNQATFTDPIGNVTSYQYDASHRLTAIQDALGTTSITYGAPNMTVTNVSRLTPAKSVISSRSFSYNTATTTTTVTDMLSGSLMAATAYLYDKNKRLIQIIDPLGHSESRTYDAKGNIMTVTDADNHTASYTYDSKGNVLTRTDALGNLTSYSYDSVFSDETSVTDPNLHTTSFKYNAQGHITSLTDGSGNITQYSYDSFGQLLSRRSPRGFSTTFTYDALGDEITRTDPLGRTDTLTYDGVGNLIQSVDPRNQTTTFSYDLGDRLQRVDWPGGWTSYTYDGLGDLTRAIDPNTNLSLSYDAALRLTGMVDNISGRNISYQYDGVGDRLQMTAPTGSVTTYVYDLASRLTQITRAGQTFGFSSDSADLLIGIQYPNGLTAAFSYDASNRPILVKNAKSDSTVVSSFSYQYDKADNVTQLTLASGDVVSYAYDNDNQLTGEVRTGTVAYNHQFTYDLSGNRMQLNTTNYNYDSADQLTSEVTGSNTVAYSYDGNGNRVQKQVSGDVITYTYDYLNRLIGYSDPGKGTTASYSYDALARRIAKTVNGSTAQYFFDLAEPIAEYNGAGVLQAENLFGLGQAEDLFGLGGIDENLARYVGANGYYYLHDGQDSVTDILDATETIQNTYDYDAWGNVLASVENISNSFTYTGREIDKESGLYYYRLRTYDALDGRFLQKDPIDDNSGDNLYSYVRNNPVLSADASGAGGVFCVAAVIAVIVVLVDGDKLDRDNDSRIRQMRAETARETIKRQQMQLEEQNEELKKKDAIIQQQQEEIERLKRQQKEMKERERQGKQGAIGLPGGANGNGCTGTDGTYGEGSRCCG